MSFFEDIPIKTICISHNRDVDGIVAAALIKKVTQCDILLTDYEQMIQTLELVKGQNNVYICDLGLTRETETPFLQQLDRIRKTAGICYIDHHSLNEKLMKTLRDRGVRTLHSTDECASVLVYQVFKDKLPKQASLLAACAAVTDDLEQGAISKGILKRYDKDLILLEASILSYAIAAKGDDDEFLMYVVNELSKLRFPHQIEHLCEYASQYAQRMLELVNDIAQEGSKMKRIAHMRTEERSLGSVANFLLGEFETPVGVAYRYKAGTDKYIVSLRSTDGFANNLGELTSKISSIVEGLGGGHSKASGAVIPRKNLDKFLELLDKELHKLQL
ncbi:MAG: DHHA1 domain-containing protein [Nitrososphaerales archaeon]